MSKTPRVDTERKYFNSDRRKWTHEQQSIYNLAEILEMELNEAKAKLDEARKLLATRVEASRLSEANLEIKQLHTDLETVNNARETARRDYHRAIDECAEFRAELEIAKGNTITAQDENSRLRTIIENNEESKKWENLYYELYDEIMFENERDSYGPTETAPECIKRIIKERNELKNKLAQSESDFNFLLKSNGKTIDENAQLKSDNKTLDFYLNESNARISKLEDAVKHLQRKTSRLLYE